METNFWRCFQTSISKCAFIIIYVRYWDTIIFNDSSHFILWTFWLYESWTKNKHFKYWNLILLLHGTSRRIYSSSFLQILGRKQLAKSCLLNITTFPWNFNMWIYYCKYYIDNWKIKCCCSFLWYLITFYFMDLLHSSFNFNWKLFRI